VACDVTYEDVAEPRRKDMQKSSSMGTALKPHVYLISCSCTLGPSYTVIVSLSAISVARISHTRKTLSILSQV
jgi:Na+/H+ antiporter NhaD/arsenite permease-like protein